MTELNKNMLIEKKLDSYGNVSDANNYIIEPELSVTITLNEYRELVERNATAQDRINKAEEGKYTRENENTKLRKELTEVRKELNKYINRYGIINNEEEINE